MEETLIPLKFPPGFFQNGTQYQAKGRWFQGNFVRFFEQTIRPIGGWTVVSDSSGNALAPFSGVGRAALGFVAADGSWFFGLATTTKLYVFGGGTLFDITPAGFITGAQDTTAATGGFGQGAFGVANFGSGATTGSFIEADVWTLDNFGSYLVGLCTSDGKPYVWLGNTSNPAITMPGYNLPGLTITGALKTNATATAGATSIALTATTLTGTVAAGQTFSFGGILYTVTGAATAAANVVTVPVTPNVVTTIASATVVDAAPTGRAIVVTPERFIMVLGSSGSLQSVAWADQASYTTWAAGAANQAGNFTLTTPGRILCGKRLTVETLIFTDVDVWRAVYVGYPLVYGFQRAGDACGVIARNAVVTVGSVAYWMGRKGFFTYNGTVQPLACEVADTVFSSLNDLQRAKVWGMAMPQFNEVWWFYPSTTVDCDQYVVYNYAEHHWTTGQMFRTAGAPAGAMPAPLLVGHDCGPFDFQTSLIYQHEIVGGAHCSVPFIVSGPVELGNGDRVLKIRRLVPDEAVLGQVSLTLLGSMYPEPTQNATAYGPYPLAAPTSVRVTGRQFLVQFTEVVQADWRIGTMRLGVRLGGRR